MERHWGRLWVIQLQPLRHENRQGRELPWEIITNDVEMTVSIAESSATSGTLPAAHLPSGVLKGGSAVSPSSWTATSAVVTTITT